MSRIDVTVVGSSPAVPRPGRASSAYLYRGLGAPILVDLGSGALASLRRVVEPETLGAIVITHMHADHFMDLVPLRYALKYGARTNDRRIPLLLPPDGDRTLRAIADAFARESAGDFLSEVFEIGSYDPAAVLGVDDATIAFAPTQHFIPTYGTRIGETGAFIAYSADTAPCAGVVALAHGAALFVCEATLPASHASGPDAGHCTPEEAAAMATQADVGRLVLTHYPSEADLAVLAGGAASAYGGAIEIADDGDRFTI